IALVALAIPARGAVRPNILLFLVDDMGCQETSVPALREPTDLNRRFHTPAMERLAARSVQYTQAYAMAVCSPSRVSLMTGYNNARHRVYCWTLRRDRSPEHSHATLASCDWNVNGLSPVTGTPRTFVCQRTLPRLLAQAGYRCIHAGKAHFGATDTPGEDPCAIGFHVNIAGGAIGGPGSYHGDKSFSAAWRGGDPIWDVPGLEKYHGQEINLTEAITREAKQAVSESVADGKPFFLYMSHYAVHAPWEADRRFIDKYQNRGLTELEAVHASMIESMDRSLGDLMDHLEQLDVADETAILFVSDNGAPSQMSRNLPLRGHKISRHEGGVRVPLFVHVPGRATSRQRNEAHQVIIEDLFPTVLEIADASELTPDDIDGCSLMPTLGGGTLAKPRPLLWHYPTYYNQQPWTALRLGDWKLIFQYHNRTFELYNLAEDLSESHNLASGRPDELGRMQETMRKLLADRGALFPTSKDDGQLVQP
ncbi:MAG: sulfatase-like hydrolase/transferase, partial [Planctomycetota bacterium]